MAEMTQVSDQSAHADRPLDRVPELIALGSFVVVLLLGAGLILIEFQLPAGFMKVAPWAALIAFGLYLRLSTPSANLLPARRIQRDERREGGVLGVLAGFTLLAAMAAATYLTSWADWAVLGSFIAVGFGAGIALHVRFTIGA